MNFYLYCPRYSPFLPDFPLNKSIYISDGWLLINNSRIVRARCTRPVLPHLRLQKLIVLLGVCNAPVQNEKLYSSLILPTSSFTQALIHPPSTVKIWP